jgi:hypothetical protein
MPNASDFGFSIEGQLPSAEVPWVRWARERLAYLESNGRGDTAEAESLRHGLAASGDA